MPNDMTPQKAAAPKRTSCILEVSAVRRVTPNMIRVTLKGPEMALLDADVAGGHCKIMLPAEGQDAAALARQMAEGPKPTTRTYTIRHARPERCEIDVDFVAHGDNGPASAWAARAKPGDTVGFAGPGAPKLTDHTADYYLIAADMSALPVAAAGLESLPKDARGIAIFEVLSAADRQQIDAPAGIEQHWLIHDDPEVESAQTTEMIAGLTLPEGRIKTLVAGETGVIRKLRLHLRGDRALPRGDVYASGYWRIGLAEDEHQKVKNVEAAAAEAKLAS
ncbi:siderophore-interacting protein [Gymnodinialimonas ceratoperidinii]|uniref:Siderophore-interacting protein n=1 Tax=Gymnodinialimonas ceratoperidinii TaxID=2856823 RepID=A0A8F6YCM3_9RHOB|nr:siderophore-interacting protein [Gymnodinialimonas ceratoperidinii]QXT39490.1 siderophore-interacting protein [Gymnodinialimonas ceratoperidinii]